MAKVYFHVDLDAFFASVEQKEHPEYKGKPVIIGGIPETDVQLFLQHHTKQENTVFILPCL